MAKHQDDVSHDAVNDYLHRERLTYGVSVKLKKVSFCVQLFKIVAPNGDIDWIITNSDASLTTNDVQDADAKR